MLTYQILYEFSQDNFGSWNFGKQDQFSVKFCLEKQGNNSKTQLALLITLNEQQVQSTCNTNNKKRAWKRDKQGTTLLFGFVFEEIKGKILFPGQGIWFSNPFCSILSRLGNKTTNPLWTKGLV